MEDNRKIFKECEVCEGTGEVFTSGLGAPPGTPIDCQACEGKGYVDWGERDDPDNVFYSYQILEELDETEHDALSDSNKANLRFLLQCGMVDMNDGKAGKTRLWAWFDSESTTRANLAALLT